MPITNPIKNAYQSYQSKQTAKRELHDAKRAAAKNFLPAGQLNIASLKEATAGVTHVLQNTRDGKVLVKHGNKDLRFSENGPSKWSQFKREEFSNTPLQLHARNTVKSIAEQHVGLARLGSNQTYEALANNVLTLLPANNVAPTPELRQAMNALNDFVQGRAANTGAQTPTEPIGTVKV